MALKKTRYEELLEIISGIVDLSAENIEVARVTPGSYQAKRYTYEAAKKILELLRPNIKKSNGFWEEQGGGCPYVSYLHTVTGEYADVSFREPASYSHAPKAVKSIKVLCRRKGVTREE